MNHSGDAAEQIVRMSLEGVEVAARITGTAAKEIALLLLAALKSPEKSSATGGMKLKGKERLTSMLKSGKALEIFSVKESDLRKFMQEAKRYGIVYCVLRNSKNAPDGLCDVMVKADDAPKINRLVERFKFAAVDTAQIESEILQERAERTPGAEPERDTAAPIDGAPSEPDAPEINDVDALLDELLGTDEGKTEPEKSEAEKADLERTDADMPAPEAPDTPETDKTEPSKPEPVKTETVKTEPEKSTLKKSARGSKRERTPAAPPAPTPKEEPANPDAAEAAKSRPSEPTSESRSKSARGTPSKPSVKKELRDITAAQKEREADAAASRRRQIESPALPEQTPTHKQPQNRRKSKKSKGR